MSNEEMIEYIQDWFPEGDPHFADLTDYLEQRYYALDFLDFITGSDL